MKSRNSSTAHLTNRPKWASSMPASQYCVWRASRPKCTGGEARSRYRHSYPRLHGISSGFILLVRSWFLFLRWCFGEFGLI
ncbi:hypothetical protein BJX99DRAFT_228416 [Aspergillus californicus]